MKGRKLLAKKFIAVACSVLLSVCLCEETCMASVSEASQKYICNKVIYEDDDWYNDPDNGYDQIDKDEEISHTAFTSEVPEGYTPIRTIDDLLGINNNPEGKYILMNDIDMTKETSPGGSWDTGNGWIPLKEFSGVFDGNGYRIIGMHMYGNFGNLVYLGLFSSIVNKSVIQNLGLVDCDINVEVGGYSSKSIGGLVGEATGDSTISNCYVDGTIRAIGGGRRVFIGGISGTANKIKDCYNMAAIYAPSSGGGTFLDSFLPNAVGGISGSADVETSYNIGKIDEDTSYGDIGGISGYRDSGNNNYYLNTTASKGNGRSKGSAYDSENGCKALTDAQMKNTSSYSGFNFNGLASESTWIIDKLSTYQYPQLCSCPQVRVEKLELLNAPDKTKYVQGDKLDLTGAVLSITYEDGIVTTTKIDENMVSGIDMDKAGMQTAIVSYLNAVCTFDITTEEMQAKSISLSKKNCTLARNKKIQLNAEITPSNVTDKSVEWISDNEIVATVTKKGIVRGINAGKAKITATTSNGLEASCVVTVTVPAKRITLNKSNLTLKKGKQKKIIATLEPLETTDTIEWISSDPKIVSVNKNGILKAKRKGYATIMAKTSSGKSAYVKIIVK